MGTSQLSCAEVIERLHTFDVTPYVIYPFLSRRTKDGGRIEYPALSWQSIVRILDTVVPGAWDSHCAGVYAIGNKLVAAWRITIHCADGDIQREALGDEADDLDSYGTSATNAEAQAKKRAAANLGLGLSLYDRNTREAILQKVRALHSTARYREAADERPVSTSASRNRSVETVYALLKAKLGLTGPPAARAVERRYGSVPENLGADDLRDLIAKLEALPGSPDRADEASSPAPAPSTGTPPPPLVGDRLAQVLLEKAREAGHAEAQIRLWISALSGQPSHDQPLAQLVSGLTQKQIVELVAMVSRPATEVAS